MATSRVLRLIQAIFLIMGLVFLLVGIGIFVHTRHFLATARHAEGTVVGLELVRSSSSSSQGVMSTTWAPRIRFAAEDGQSYQFVSNASSNPPAYTRGEHVGVLFDPARPESAKIDGFFALWGMASIFTALGAIFVSIIAAVFVCLRRGKARRASLLRSGTRIEARFQSVTHNGAVTVNGRSPWRIVAQWQDPATALLYVFESENLWFDPSGFVRQETIPVYIEPGNPKRYAMDLSFLPRQA